MAAPMVTVNMVRLIPLIHLIPLQTSEQPILIGPEPRCLETDMIEAVP